MREEIKPAELLDVLKSRIAGFSPETEEVEIGRVLQAGDGIAQVWGLDNILMGELVEIELDDGSSIEGMVMNLEEESVGVILFSGYERVKEGCLVKRTRSVAQVPAGEALLGRVVDPLGNPLDGLGSIEASQYNRVEAKGPGIIDRQDVSEPLQTGLKAIDSMIPVGRGQRELIIGDRRTGKSTIAVDTILNQKNSSPEDRVYCFYVAIGQKRSSVVQIIETLKRYGVMEYTTVVAATASDPASLQYLAPYAAMAMAEYFRDSGRHALVIFDDLTKHSQAYRELSLLMRRSPGREAYPGDIFYLHSRLLERAAKMSDERGGGSLTALPIVETQEGDVSAYIPTNVISITDGQIFLETGLFNSGLRPAINVGISVSRVGGDAQLKVMKQTSGSLRIDLAQFRELAAFMQFSSDLDSATKAQLKRGECLTEILKQPQYSPIDVFKQVMILKAGTSGRLDKYPTNKLLSYQKELFDYLDENESEFMSLLRAKKAFDDALEEEAEQIFDKFEKRFRPGASAAGADSGFNANLSLAMSEHHSSINKDMLKLVERLSAREFPGKKIKEEVEEIISGKDENEQDRFGALISSCTIIDYNKNSSRDDLFKKASKLLSDKDLDPKKLYELFVEREESSSTALSDFFAVPHVIVEKEETFKLLIVRSTRGINFDDERDGVKSLFFLVGSRDQRHFHLVTLTALASVVQSSDFEKNWLDAGSTEELRQLILRAKR